MKKYKVMLCGVMCLCGIMTACENKKNTSETPPVIEIEITGYRPAEIELSQDFEEIISLDSYVGDIYIFGKLKTGGYSGYVADGNFNNYTKMNFVQQKNEIVKSSALLPFGKKAVLTYLDGKTMIYVYDINGVQEKVLDCGEILDSPEVSAEILSCGRNGYVINISDKKFSYILDNGEYAGDIKISGDVSCISRGTDNDLNYLYTDEGISYIAGTDIKSLSVTDTRKISVSGATALCTGEKYNYIGVFSDGIYGYENGDFHRITDFSNMDFNPSDVKDIVETDSGYVVSLNNGSIAFITANNITSLKTKRVILIGDLGNKYYSDLNKLAEFYNESHSDGDYRVDFREYHKEYQNGNDALKADILSGNAPDIIHFTGNLTIDDFGSNYDYFADLYPFIDNDPELSREDFLPNILTGLERHGELNQIGTQFYIKTVQARKDVPENWTTDDLIEIYNNLKESERLIDERMLLRDNYFFGLFDFSLFVDYNKSECHFDSPEIVKFLEFIQNNEMGISLKELDMDIENSMPESLFLEKFIIEQEYNDMTESIFHMNSYLYDMQSLFDYARSNEDLVLAGYLSDGEKSSTSIVFDDFYSIIADSQNIDGAWDFLRTLYTEETKDFVHIYRFPVKTELLDKEFEIYSRDLAYIDSRTGKTVVEKRRCLDREVENFTPEECEYYKDKIMSMGVGSYNIEIYNIVYQEITKYFNGEITSGQTVKNIQKRASAYLKGE